MRQIHERLITGESLYRYHRDGQSHEPDRLDAQEEGGVGVDRVWKREGDSGAANVAGAVRNAVTGQLRHVEVAARRIQRNLVEPPVVDVEHPVAFGGLVSQSEANPEDAAVAAKARFRCVHFAEGAAACADV